MKTSFGVEKCNNGYEGTRDRTAMNLYIEAMQSCGLQSLEGCERMKSAKCQLSLPMFRLRVGFEELGERRLMCSGDICFEGAREGRDSP